jgi:hypothetical protein
LVPFKNAEVLRSHADAEGSRIRFRPRHAQDQKIRRVRTHEHISGVFYLKYIFPRFVLNPFARRQLTIYSFRWCNCALMNLAVSRESLACQHCSY